MTRLHNPHHHVIDRPPVHAQRAAVGGLTPAEAGHDPRRLEAFADDFFASLPAPISPPAGSAICVGCCWTAGARRWSRWPSGWARCTIKPCITSSWPARRAGGAHQRLARVLADALVPVAWVLDDPGVPKDGPCSVASASPCGSCLASCRFCLPFGWRWFELQPSGVAVAASDVTTTVPPLESPIGDSRERSRSSAAAGARWCSAAGGCLTALGQVDGRVGGEGETISPPTASSVKVSTAAMLTLQRSSSSVVADDGWRRLVGTPPAADGVYPVGAGAEGSFCQRPNSFPSVSLQTVNQPMPGTGPGSFAWPPSSLTRAAPVLMSSTSK